ncbi:HAD family hydrolase [Saccharopolyspora rhizosphaerae]|uniref:HAD family hydrolase n=1 Tax=Saccharopolyspora rhizosphaerae TaxID=2492662 RepID=A0A3R8QBI5_9PSEU|nr:HAD-IA family hydrolase [Saccharopolyspora rhizosphaerae]RRO17278.1 HAD family hydrolase [Saccharopolyspora rhizosphaerae]
MTLRAVIFDFSGTLFRLEENASWYADLTDADGGRFDLAAQAEVMRRMTAPSGQVVELGAEFVEAWEKRDLDPELHRKVYVEVLRSSGVPDPQADGLYARLIDPDQWTPYPDTAEVLRRLSEQGVKVGVISNIAFDIRPAFDRLDITEHVDEFLLSYLEEVIKPDPKIFLRACERLGVAPEEALMVGDSVEADGGAAAVGCQVAIVDPVPTSERPTGLIDAVGDLLR